MQNPKKSSFHIVGGLTEIFFFVIFIKIWRMKKNLQKNPLRRGNRSCEPLFYCAHIFYCSIVFFQIQKWIWIYLLKIGCRIKHWSQYFNRLVWLTASSVFSFIYDDDEYWISTTMTFSVSHTWYYFFSISRINTDTHISRINSHKKWCSLGR